MAETPDKPEPAPRESLALRLRDLAIYALLLLGPLWAVERWVGSQVRELVPYLRHYNYRADLHLMLLDAREACPDAVVLGSSQSERSVKPAQLLGQDIGDGVTIDDPFTFAVAGVRGTTMLEMWLELVDRGCVPEVVFVELNPIALNAAKGGVIHDPPYLGARTHLRMPAGFAAEREYELAKLAEFWTNDRLLIHRRRDRIVEAFEDELGWRGRFELGPDPDSNKKPPKPAKVPKPWTKDLPLDGQVTRGASKRKLDGKYWPREVRKRHHIAKAGKLVYRHGPVEAASILALIDDAERRGTRVILHSPPVTSLYPEVLAMVDMDADWAEFAALLRAEHGDIWFDTMRDDERYPPKYFSDYVHLNRWGSKRYGEDLLAAARAQVEAQAPD